MFFKKTQIALEFIITTLFAIVIIGFALALIGSQSKELQYYQDYKYIEDYISSIENEINIMNEMNEGYYREVRIPSEIEEYYTIKIINHSFLVINNITNQSYLFRFPYNGTVGKIKKSETINGVNINFTYLYFKK